MNKAVNIKICLFLAMKKKKKMGVNIKVNK